MQCECKAWDRNKAEILNEALSLIIHATSLPILITAHFNMCYMYVKTAVLCHTERMFGSNRLHKTSLLRHSKANAAPPLMVTVLVVLKASHLTYTKL
jgi:hypothetical protein